MKKIHIDIETFCEAQLPKTGVHKYADHPTFTILLLAFQIEDKDIVCLDMYNRRAYSIFSSDPDNLFDALSPENLIEENFEDNLQLVINAIHDKDTIIHAHNATFERVCLSKYFNYEIPVERTRCSMIRAGFAGLPMGLDDVGRALNINNKKLSAGKALIRIFSMPQKPSKRNKYSTRILPEDDPLQWNWYITYCIGDVAAEMQVEEALKGIEISDFEWGLYKMDQDINARGIMVDLELAKQAASMRDKLFEEAAEKIKSITGVDNPNSASQIKGWIQDTTGEQVESLNKSAIAEVIERVSDDDVEEVLEERAELSKSSLSKYDAMIECAGEDSRARDLFQFYGASRTGRWAGRIIQLQNLVRNKMTTLDEARLLVRDGDLEMLRMLYDKPSDVLAQLIRTAFIAPPGKIFAIADLSAIEARVIARLAEEKWRLDVFAGHGKIYEASASMMFNVPIEQVGHGSELRAKGKISELALGYNGGVGAIARMDTNNDIPAEDRQGIVDLWREKSPNIVQLWKDYQLCAMQAILTGKPQQAPYMGITFRLESNWLTMELPSGRKLYYYMPKVTTIIDNWGRPRKEILYIGTNQQTRKLEKTKIYGGKFTENCLHPFTLVATNTGWKYLIEIQDHDRIWDGEKFAPHSGLVFKGLRTTIRVKGVCMTDDHLVWTNKKWKKSKDTLYKNLTILEPALPSWFPAPPEVPSVIPLPNEETPVYDLLEVGDLHQFVIFGDDHPILVHNCTQAVARDIQAVNMKKITDAGYPIVMHVHDEVVCEVNEQTAEDDLKRIIDICKVNPEWFPGVKLSAEGFVSKYYKKD